MSADAQKQAASRAAADLIEPGMKVGLGTGSTAAHFIAALGARKLGGLRCVPTSSASEALARQAGLDVTVRQLLQHQTISELAATTGSLGPTEEQPPEPAGVLKGCDPFVETPEVSRCRNL